VSTLRQFFKLFISNGLVPKKWLPTRKMVNTIFGIVLFSIVVMDVPPENKFQPY
jgi:hypothetical protein